MLYLWYQGVTRRASNSYGYMWLANFIHGEYVRWRSYFLDIFPPWGISHAKTTPLFAKIIAFEEEKKIEIVIGASNTEMMIPSNCCITLKGSLLPC